MMPSGAVERQKRYIARKPIAADPQKRAEFLMKDRERKKKEVSWAQNEMSHVIRHHEPWYAKMKETYVLVFIFGSTV